MAQANIKVTFNSLYTPEAYDNLVSDNPISGKVYLLSDKNGNTGTGMFTDYGIIKKDGVNYTGIVGVLGENNKLLGNTPKEIRLGDYTLYISVSDKGVLSISNQGNLKNYWEKELNKPIILDVEAEQQSRYVQQSKYGTPILSINGTELIDIDELTPIKNSSDELVCYYRKATNSASNISELILKAPENLNGKDKSITVTYKVPEGRDAEIIYGEISDNYEIKVNLLNYTGELTCDKTVCNKDDIIKFTYRTTSLTKEVPVNYKFSTTGSLNVLYERSEGIEKIDDNNFIIKSINNTKEAYIYCKAIQSGVTAKIQGPAATLVDANNYRYSAITKNSIYATCNIAKLSTYSIYSDTNIPTFVTSVSIQSVAQNITSGESILTGTTIASIRFNRGYILNSNTITLEDGSVCDFKDVTYATSGTNSANIVTKSNITMTSNIKLSIGEALFKVINVKVEPISNATVTYSPTTTATLTGNSTTNAVYKVTVNEGYILTGATVNCTIDGGALDSKYYTWTESTGTLTIKSDAAKIKDYDGKTIKIEVLAAQEAILGYYSFNATNITEMASLKESDFIPIKSTTGNTVKPTIGGKTVILTESANAPTMKFYLSSYARYGNPITMRAGNEISGTTKTIKGKQYNLWIDYTTIVDNHDHINYTIN